METKTKSSPGVANNKGKFAVLLLYASVVYIFPLFYLTSYSHQRLVEMVQSIVQKDTDERFRQYIALLHRGDADQAHSLLAEEVQKNVPISDVHALSRFLARTTNQMEIVSGNRTARSSGDNTTTTYRLHYEIANNDPVYKFVLAQVVAQDTGSGAVILGVQIAGQHQSIKEQARLDLRSQGIYLLLALLIPMFIIYSALRYITTNANPKWLVFLIILFLSLYISITSSGAQFNAQFGFGLWGFGAPTGPWGPWVFSTPVPLGAIYYWFARAIARVEQAFR